MELKQSSSLNTQLKLVTAHSIRPQSLIFLCTSAEHPGDPLRKRQELRLVEKLEFI